MPGLGDLNIRIGTSIDNMVKGLTAAERRLSKSVRIFDRLGTQLTNSISLPLAAAGAAGLKFAFDLDKSFAKIENLVGIGGDALQELKTGVKDLSGPLASFQGELSGALFTITSAGARGADALKTLEQASKASAIGLGDTTAIARAATAVVNNYGKANINASTAIDQFTAAARVGNFETEELAPSIGKVLPLAKALGISFAEVSANVATFTKGGVSAKESITGLKSLLSNIVKPTKQTKEALASVGVTTQGLQESIKQKGLAATLVELVSLFDGNTEALSKVIPNVEGLVNALSVAGSQGEDYADNLKEIESSTGIVDKGFKNVSEGGAFKLKQALVSLQNVSIDLGNILVPIATKIISKFTAAVGVFSKMHPELKKITIALGFLLASIGPVFKAIAALKNLKLTYIKVSKIMLLSVKTLGGKLINLAVSFQKLNLVMKASTIGLIIAGIAAAILIFQKYNTTVSEAERLQQSFNNIELKAAQSIAGQKVELDKLSKVINDVNTRRDDQVKAIERLKKISPSYFGALDSEKIKLDDINAALKEYTANIESRAKLQAANERLVEIEKKLLDTQGRLEDSDPSYWDQATNAVLAFGNAGKLAALNTKSQLSGFVKTTKALNTEKDALLKYITATESAIVAKGKFGIDPTTTTTSLKDLSGPVAQPVDEDAIAAEQKALSQKLRFIKDINDENGKAVALNGSLAASLKAVSEGNIQAGEQMGIASIKAAEYRERMVKLAETAQVFSEGLTNIVNTALVDFTSSFAEGLGSVAAGTATLKDVGKQALGGLAQMLIDVGKLAIQTGVAVAGIRVALKSLNPVVAIAAGAALVALGSLVKGKLADKTPALAEGGLAFGPTTAIVGDNPNARANPEVIAPLDKLKSMLGGMGGSYNINGVLTARGADLSLVLDRNDFRKRRTSG